MALIGFVPLPLVGLVEGIGINRAHTNPTIDMIFFLLSPAGSRAGAYERREHNARCLEYFMQERLKDKQEFALLTAPHPQIGSLVF